jgi:hypothetical protein
MEFIEECISRAERGESQLTKDILELNGMSSSKVRHLLNNICSVRNTKYLEVGSWRGSTFISALYDNLCQGVSIDNFSEFVLPHPHTQEWLALSSTASRNKPIHPKEEFEANLQEFLVPKFPACLYNNFDSDCQDPDLLDALKDWGGFNVYFYDGNHSYESQYLGIKNYLPLLKNDAIIIVDDWNASDASLGTVDALKDCGKVIKYRKDLMSNGNCDRGGWWNGIGIIVCE